VSFIVRSGIILAALLAAQSPAAAALSIEKPDLAAIEAAVLAGAAQAEATAAGVTVQAQALQDEFPVPIPSPAEIEAWLAQAEAATGMAEAEAMSASIDALLASVPSFAEIEALVEEAKATVAASLATLDQIPEAPCIPGVSCPGDLPGATPEPASGLLLAAGLAGLAWRRRLNHR
jgi:hypothetical protein